jgi:hypothetical protein
VTAVITIAPEGTRAIRASSWRPTPALEMRDALNFVDDAGTGVVDHQSKAALSAHALPAADILPQD